MNALEHAIDVAIQESGQSTQANKAYLEFIKANFIIPIEKQSESQEPQVLYFNTDTHTFLPVFTSMVYFDAWAAPIKERVALLKLSGVDLLKGLGEQTIVSLNIGSPIYKEFNASELARMRSMVIKLFGNN